VKRSTGQANGQAFASDERKRSAEPSDNDADDYEARHAGKPLADQAFYLDVLTQLNEMADPFFTGGELRRSLGRKPCGPDLACIAKTAEQLSEAFGQLATFVHRLDVVYPTEGTEMSGLRIANWLTKITELTVTSCSPLYCGDVESSPTSTEGKPQHHYEPSPAEWLREEFAEFLVAEQASRAVA